nr:hypothetical protein [Tessaracoccus coleopterorum]
MTQLRRIADQVAHRGDVYDTMGFRTRMNRGLGISVLFAGRAAPGRPPPPRCWPATSTCCSTGSTCPRSWTSTSARPRRTCAGCSTRPRAAAPSCSSTRPTPCSGAAARCATATTGTPTSRSTTSCSGSRATRARDPRDQPPQRPRPGVRAQAPLHRHVPVPRPRPAHRDVAAALPPAVPVEGIDAARLARLDLTGGSIQAIALNAAFLAAAAGSPVTMPLLLDAARAELRKLDKPVNEADFRWPEPAGGRHERPDRAQHRHGGARRRARHPARARPVPRALEAELTRLLAEHDLPDPGRDRPDPAPSPR